VASEWSMHARQCCMYDHSGCMVVLGAYTVHCMDWCELGRFCELLGHFADLVAEKVLCAGKKPEGKKKLGFVKIDVADVVENRHLLDTWPLMDSQQGEIEMKLEWMPLQLENI